VRVRVLYFAAARDLVKNREESLNVKEGASVGDLSMEIFRLHPALKRLAQSVRFSVNLALAEQGALLRESDVVGVLPPVAGG